MPVKLKQQDHGTRKWRQCRSFYQPEIYKDIKLLSSSWKRLIVTNIQIQTKHNYNLGTTLIIDCLKKLWMLGSKQSKWLDVEGSAACRRPPVGHTPVSTGPDTQGFTRPGETLSCIGKVIMGGGYISENHVLL